MMHAGTTRRAQAGGIVIALLVAAFLTVQLSLAAFTDETTNPDNTFAAGEVTISESRGGTAMFDVTGIVPGWSASEQVTVTNSSTVDTEVALYVSDIADTGLAPFLHVTVSRDGAAQYDGALTALPQSFAAATAVAEGAATSTVYEFEVSLPQGQAGVNAAQGTGAVVAFTWEARSVSP